MVLNQNIAAQIIGLLKKNPQGLIISEIANESKINRIPPEDISKSLASGQVDMRRHGMAKIYFLSHRIPLSAVLSLSSEFIMQLDEHLRIVYINEPFIEFLGTTRKNLVGKNVQYSPLVLVLDDLFESFLTQVKNGIEGIEWKGEFFLRPQKIIIACRVIPIVFEDGQKGVSVTCEDITDRKRLMKALRESEEIYSRIIETAHEGIWILDRDFHTTFINQRLTDILGYSLEEMAGHSVKDHVVAEDKATMEAQFIGRRTGIKSCYEIGLKHKDGRTIWCLVSESPLLDNNGSFLGSFGMLTDITDRKKSENALQESEEKYRSIIETLPDGVSVIDKDLKVIFANSNLLSWMHILGLPNDIIGRTVLDAFPFLSPIVVDEYRTVFLAGRIVVTQETSPIGDAEIVTETRKIPIKENDETVAVVTIIRNITERKQAEEKLRQSEERYHNLYRDSTQGIFRSTIEGRFIDVNPAMARMLGYNSPDEVVRAITSIADQVYFEPPKYDTVAKAAMDAGGFINTINRYRRKDGSLWYGNLNLHIVTDKNATSSHYEGFVEDITERLMAEEALAESEKKYRDIFENSVSGLFRSTPAGQLIKVNDAFARMYGFTSAAELLASDSAHAPPPYARQKDRQDVLTILAKEGQCLDYETQHVKRDGTPFWVSLSVRAVRDTDDTLLMFDGIINDITRRKRAPKRRSGRQTRN